jgi:preprotein translocase subunit SecE
MKRQALPVQRKGRLKFFGETASELRKVVWPSRRDAINLTIIVIIISVAVGLTLGLIDLGFGRLIRVFLLGG